MHRVKIHQGDINKLSVDAIVSASGCASQLYALPATMPALGAARLNEAQCPVGEVVIGAADDLPAEMVIYTVGPTWRGGDYQEEQQLASCYHNAMNAAKKQNLKSIAFPAISCGASGFPTRRAAKIAIHEVNQALRQNPLLESVVFCCFDPVTAALYRNQMGK